MTINPFIAIKELFVKIRFTKAFELFMVGVIVFSAVMIGAKTYDAPPTFESVIFWLDWFITIVFLIEITIRFFAEKSTADFFKSGWNIFDTLIVLISLIPIEDSELAIIARLLRIFRVLRMISIIPELRVLLNSLFKALPRLGYVALLMFIIFYIYAAIGATLFGTINAYLWGDIARSLLTLFRVMTFEDWTDVMYETMEVYSISWIYYLSFIFFTAFAFLNLIIGIVVNVLEEEHAKENLHKKQSEPSLQEVYDELQELRKILQNQPPSSQ